MLKPLIYLSLLLVFGFSASAQIAFQQSSWEEILAKAAEEDKYVFVDTYADWCAPCKKMDKEVFPQKTVGTFFNQHFISIRMDMDEEQYKAFARDYQVRTYPTYLFFNPEGKLVHRAIGYMPEEDFLDAGNSALAPKSQSEKLFKRYKEGDRNPQLLYEFAYSAHASHDPIYRDALELYLKSQEDWTTEKVEKIIFDLADQHDKLAFDYLIAHKEDFKKRIGETIVKDKLLEISLGEIEVLLMEKGNSVKAEEFTTIFDKYFEAGEANKYGSLMAINYYNSLRAWDEMVTAVDAFIKQHLDLLESHQQVQLLLSLSQQLVEGSETPKHLQAAIRWTEQVSTIDEATSKPLLIQAAAQFKLGDKDKANAALDAAQKQLKAYPDATAQKQYEQLRARFAD